MSVAWFEQIVGDYEEYLSNLARRMMRNREDAEEVVQDALVRAHRAMSIMSPHERRELRLKSWLYTITLNVARNRLRRKTPFSVSIDATEDPERLFPRATSSPTPETLFERRVEMELVEDALRHVPARLRPTAVLRFIEGRTHPEIAEIFSQPVGTVKSHVHRAALIMRRFLADHVGAA
jgi:RNA polymerase sigma-70 factor, ECF subfamily